MQRSLWEYFRPCTEDRTVLECQHATIRLACQKIVWLLSYYCRQLFRPFDITGMYLQCTNTSHDLDLALGSMSLARQQISELRPCAQSQHRFYLRLEVQMHRKSTARPEIRCLVNNFRDNSSMFRCFETWMIRSANAPLAHAPIHSLIHRECTIKDLVI